MTDAEFIQEVTELIIGDVPADNWSREELLAQIEAQLEELFKLQIDQLNHQVEQTKMGIYKCGGKL
jgi:hypothetical protein